MSDFKTLKGLYIKNRSSDPANPIEGEIWYNTTTGTLKVAPKLAAWSSGGNLNTGRINEKKMVQLFNRVLKLI